MTDDRTTFQTQSAVSGQQGVAGHLGAHLVIAQDKVGQDGEHCVTRRALDTPDGETTQTDADIMRVARQAPAAATGRLLPELKAQGQHEGHDTFEKRLAIAKELNVGRFVSKIDADRAVFSGRFGCYCH
jgi:hypothetical protein